jgi:hypothetical protein
VSLLLLPLLLLVLIFSGICSITDSMTNFVFGSSKIKKAFDQRLPFSEILVSVSRLDIDLPVTQDLPFPRFSFQESPPCFSDFLYNPVD